jgi:spore coat protein A
MTHAKHSPPVNPRRRQLLQATAALAMPAIPALRATAAVTGNNAVTSWAVNSDPGIYAQAWAARFTNAFINPLSTSVFPGTNITGFYKADTGTSNIFTITAAQGTANVLGVAGKTTPIWGYRNQETSVPTFPGRTFQVQRNSAVTVRWRNALATASGPLPHLMPVDQSITLQTPTTGVPLAVPTTVVTRRSSSTVAPTNGPPRCASRWAPASPRPTSTPPARACSTST